MSFRPLKELTQNDKGLIIEELKAVLKRHEEIVFALLFGSLVNPPISGKYGDMDIALYVTPDSIRTAEYVLEARIEAEIYNALTPRGVSFPPPEVLILNNAPNHFQVGIFKGNYEVLKGEEGAITDFVEEIGGKSMANFHFRMESLREFLEG
jgi:predicted nucleotidyltransferase